MSYVLNLLFPKLCVSCNQVGEYICSDCQTHLHTKPVVYSSDGLLDGRLSVFRFHGTIRRLIHQYKYNFVFDMDSFIATLISSRLASDYPNLLKYWQDQMFVIVPIPLHWRRRNYRGFNQSENICRFLSSRLSLPIQDILIRTRFTMSQVKQSSKLLRLTNLNSSFDIQPDLVTAPTRIILVDDVITTGATITQAAQVLRNHGATSVWALSLAG